jgi:hypothetical protein
MYQRRKFLARKEVGKKGLSLSAISPAGDDFLCGAGNERENLLNGRGEFQPIIDGLRFDP